jgi:hypothetical protein
MVEKTIWRSVRWVLVCLLEIMFVAPAVPQTGVTRIWAVDDGEKVKQNDLQHWAAASPQNRVWDGSTIRLFAARNEIVAFQIILEAAGSGAQQVTVAFDSLQNGATLITNRFSNDPYSYVGRYIEMFVEHYQNVTSRSPYGTSNGEMEARPLPDAEHLGLIPDALVPFDAPVKKPSHGQGGAPFDIAAGRNQAVWVDIYVPKWASAGTYAGTVRVVEGGVTTRRIPLQLNVYDVVLPDETHQKSFFIWNAGLLANRYGITAESNQYWTLFQRFMNTAHRHRMSLVDGFRTLTGTNGFVNRLSGYYTGAWYTASQGYEGPGTGTGDNLYAIGAYDQPNNGWQSGFWPNEAAAWQGAADNWEQWFLDNAPNTLRFKYMDDEPNMQDAAIMDVLRQKCAWITSSSGVGKNLHRFTTREYVYGGLYGSVDFWGLCGTPGVQLNVMRDRKNRGELFAIYNGTRPTWGQMELVDNFATDNRVNPWICWKYGVDVIFLWETSYYAEMKSPHPSAVNTWEQNFIPGTSGKSWGAGMWLYPGRESEYPMDDRGVDGPITSIRMKNFRRGQQDVECMWLAKQSGVDVTDLINRVVPRAFDDWGSTEYKNPPGYNQQPVFATRGYVYEDARREMLERLQVVGKGNSFPSGSLRVSPGVVTSSGGAVTLAWTSNNATEASIDNGVGAVPVSGSTQVQVSSTTSFALTLKNQLGSTTVRADVNVGTPLLSQVLQNPSFGEGTSSWVFYTNGVGEFSVVKPGGNRSEVAVMPIQQPGSNTQLFQADLRIDPGSRYQLTFDARSSTGHDLDAAVIQHVAPYADYGLPATSVDLLPSWKTFEFLFTTGSLSAPVNDGRVMLWFAPYAAAGDTFMVDHVSLLKISNSTGVVVSQDVPSRWELLQNFPNPFNPSTSISFEVPRTEKVAMKVYTLLGEEVATLVDGVREAGVHTVRFDPTGLASGVYIYRLTAPGVTRAGKMVLSK